MKTEHSVRALSSCIYFPLLQRTKFSLSKPLMHDMKLDGLIISDHPDAITHVMSEKVKSESAFLSINPNNSKNGYEN